jgi:hypothetical protein
MMRYHAIDYASGPDLADRLALTAQDRRLESLVLLQMIRSSASVRDPATTGSEFADPHPRNNSDPAEASTYTHALNIASFLSEEFRLESLEQKILASEVAVELARRIAEELAEIMELPPEAPTA